MDNELSSKEVFKLVSSVYRVKLASVISSK